MDRQLRTVLRGAAALLLVLLLAAPAFSGADSALMTDADLLLAGNAIHAFGVKGADGEELVPRRAAEMPGRGVPGAGLAEPDYVGVVGYATLPPSEKASTFSTFGQTPWLIPAYEKQGEKFVESGTLPHKTPVVVINQILRPGQDQRYRGYLRVIRLDTNKVVWIKVTEFVTLPYWTLPVTEAVLHGNCIAVYRNASRYEPRDRGARSGSMPDGTHILLCDVGGARFSSPDPLKNPLLGIVFPKGEETEEGLFLFFNPADLTLVY